tara:strand:- start:739 stop:3348 length:2610 start_codon:yes stop_codon:yes gene_type:complete
VATWYVDFESGTGDGSTTSSPAGYFDAINGSNNVAAGDTIKIKGSPNPTLLGTATAYSAYGHSMWYASSSFPTLTYSTTAGETTAEFHSSYGNMTGRTMEIEGNTQDKGNFNGLWRVGANVSGNTYKIEEFQGTGSGTGSGSNGSFWDASGKVLYLDSTPVKALASTGPRTNSWTAASDVTATLDFNGSPEWSSTHRNFEHRCSDQIVISANHGTGLAAYYPITSLTSSTYQQISFYVCQSSGTYTDGISLRLCTGSDGTGSVKTIPINTSYQSKSGTWRWKAVVKDFGQALNSSGNINSVALYVDTDNGARTMHISNIIACKASSANDSITHNSLIGFNTTADPFWRTIKSIRDLPDGKTRIECWTGRMNNEPTGYQSAGRVAGFAQNYSSANIYKREAILASDSNLNNSSATIFQIASSTMNGSSGSPITISGGWNSDYSSQSLDHSIINFDRSQRFSILSSNSYINISKFGIMNPEEGTMRLRCTHSELDDVIFAGNTGSSNLYGYNSSFYKFKVVFYALGMSSHAFNNYYNQFLNSSGSDATIADKDNFELFLVYSGAGSSWGSSQYSNLVFNKLHVFGTSYNGYGFYFQVNGDKFIVDDLKFTSGQHLLNYNMKKPSVFYVNNLTFYNVAQPLRFWGGNDYTINNFSDSGDQTGVQYSYQEDAVDVTEGMNMTFLESITVVNKRLKVTDGALFSKNDSITGTYANNKVYLTKGSWHKRDAGGVSGVFENFYSNGLIYPETSIRNTASGYSWKFTTTNTSAATSADPLALELGTIAVNGGNKTVTVTAYVYRTSSSAYGRLRVKANNLIGLTSDVTTTSSGSTNSWEQLSLTFNPSASGYVDIVIEAYDGNSNVYFDDLGVTQAT